MSFIDMVLWFISVESLLQFFTIFLFGFFVLRIFRSFKAFLVTYNKIHNPDVEKVISYYNTLYDSFMYFSKYDN
jgi:hypothetical protein